MYANEAEFMEVPYTRALQVAIDLSDNYVDEFLHTAASLNDISVDISYIAGIIEFEYNVAYCGCCDDFLECCNIPLSYIWTENWRELATQQQEEEAIAESKAREGRRIQEKERLTKQRYKQYLELKQEFEPQPQVDT